MGSTILVVDDEPIITETVSAILRGDGFDVTGITDPGLVLTSALTLQPALAIIDLIMPSISGFDLAIKLTELCPQTKILLFSGHPDSLNTLIQLNERGVEFEFIEKPVRADKLLMRVHRLTAETHPGLLLPAPSVSPLPARPDATTTIETKPIDPVH